MLPFPKDNLTRLVLVEKKFGVFRYVSIHEDTNEEFGRVAIWGQNFFEFAGANLEESLEGLR